MNKLVNSLLIIFLLITTNSEADVPELKSGDVIFQTSSSKQSYAIMWASKSLYSHVGLVEVDGKKKYVLEAISKVSRTSLEKWIERGRLGRYAVYRYEDLSVAKANEIVKGAKKLLGKSYDLYFTSKNDQIYCSELVESAYKDAGFLLGKPEKVKDLDVDNMLVRKLVEKRWRKHPLCSKATKNFEECWAKILNDELISPEGLTKDTRLKQIWSNYP